MIKNEGNESYLQSGLNLIQEAITIFDAQLKLVAWNTRFVTMFDLPYSLVKYGQSYIEILRFLIARGEYGTIENPEEYLIERTEQALAFEPHYFERMRANGETISIEGHPLAQGGWVTVYTDITETKRKETLLEARSENLREQISGYFSELSEANRALRATVSALEETKSQLMASEERIRLALDHAPAHIAQINRERRYLYSNGGLSRLLSGMPDKLVGKTVSQIWGKETYKKFSPAISEAFKGHRPVREITHINSGKRMRVAFTPYREGSDPNSPVIAVNVMTLDITEETIAREMIAQANRRSTAGMMVSGLAHDFANLLLIIQSAQSQLSHSLKTRKERESVEVTLKAAERGRDLIQRISHMTTGGSNKREAVDIADVFDELAYFVQPLLKDRVALTVTPTTQPITCDIDRGYMIDCLVNLIINAQDSIAENQNDGQITITAEYRNEKARIYVRDNGPGFSAEALTHGFLPFFTTKQGEGSGLGLSMVYDLVKQVGGIVKLRNHAQGAEVFMELPASLQNRANADGRALLVENDALIRSETRGILRQLGFAVIEASTAEDAIAYENEGPFALVLSDIDLGGALNGLDVAEYYRGVTQIILTSAMPASHPLRQQAERTFDFIAKPLSHARLVKVMKVNT